MAHASDPAPDSTSSAYEATKADRLLVRDMLAGLPAIQVLARSNLTVDERRYVVRETYLTRWPNETAEGYRRRVDDACFTPLFEDLLFGLTSKPFAKEVAIKEGASARVEALTEDIDGEGNNLHTFAHRLFEAGIRDGLCAVLVDYPVNPGTLTRRDEMAMALRPYWVRVEAADLIALYTETVGGVERITHARIMETTVERDGFAEVTKNRVRVLEPGVWQLWETMEGADGKTGWVMTAEGVTSLDYVPLVVFYAGNRVGPQMVRPPLVNLARMQVELFRQENNLKSVETRAAYPMLAANGMSPPTDGNTLTVGPMAVLFGGEGGSWEILEPNGSSLEHLRQRIEETKQEMRRLGMQPLLPGSGTITATASGIEASKAHSAVQMWALGLKDTLENALRITADWLGEASEAEVFVHTDFDVGFMSDQSLQALLALKEGGSISRRALLEEMKRRNVLAADYDIDADAEVIDEERTALMEALPDLMPVDQPAAEPPQSNDPRASLRRGMSRVVGGVAA